MNAVASAVAAALNAPLKIDIGCGKNKQAGFIGIDQYEMAGVDVVADLRGKRWRFGICPAEIKPRLSSGVKYQRLVTPPEAGELVLTPYVAEEEGFEFADNSVDEAHCSHFLEHLTNFGGAWERVKFFNELHRILKPGGFCRLIFPHWSSNRYYGDPTHKEPFSEMGFYYLSRAWRLGGTPENANGNAPHTDVSINPEGYACDFDATWAYGMHGELLKRNQDYQMFALSNFKEAASDIIATITKRAPPPGG